MRKIDLTGQKFGRLTVIKEIEPYIAPRGAKWVQWECICDCGKIVHATTETLRRGTTRSCGCLAAEEKRRRGRTIPKDLMGQKFGHLTVLGCTRKQSGKRAWSCICDCGKQTVVGTYELTSGLVKSCGAGEHKVIHGKRNSRLYRIYNAMKQRCHNPTSQSYQWYGAKGISVCDEWRDDFQAFYDWAMANGYNPDAPRGECSIDRIDVNGNYCPENCRWVTMQKQQFNKHTTRVFSYNGEQMTVAEFSKKYGIKEETLSTRLQRGKTIAEAIETPVAKRKVAAE